MKLNKKKNYFRKSFSKSISFVIFFISLISSKDGLLNAENLLKELELDTTTKTEEGGSVIPTNPFEIVEMIRRQNSMNDATSPTDAIDDALESFNSSEEK